MTSRCDPPVPALRRKIAAVLALRAGVRTVAAWALALGTLVLVLRTALGVGDGRWLVAGVGCLPPLNPGGPIAAPEW